MVCCMIAGAIYTSSGPREGRAGTDMPPFGALGGPAAGAQIYTQAVYVTTDSFFAQIFLARQLVLIT